MGKLEVKNPVFKKAGEALHVLSKDSLARIEYDRRKATLYFYDAASWRSSRFACKAEGDTCNSRIAWRLQGRVILRDAFTCLTLIRASIGLLP